MGLKFRNPKFNISGKVAFFFFNKMLTLWSSEVNKAIPEQVTVAGYDYYLYASIF